MAETCLVVVESPGKVKTIKKYLDSLFPGVYAVEASYGHICDLPRKDLGFDTKTFLAEYQIYEDKIDIVKRLKASAKRCGSVILAMDDDREGEAIAAHIRRELGLKDPDRITFTSITKDALEMALKQPRKIDQNKVNSQETRRLLDRMIGWQVSQVARTYVVPESSMGRVQTAVLCLLVDLERRIKNFKTTQHYGVEAFMINKEGGQALPWVANWDVSKWLKKDEPYWLDRVSAQEVAKIGRLRVTAVKDGTSESSPPPPFITSTLQRAAQKLLKISPKKTMELAQKLYEAGAITYMRTDNPNLSPEAFVALKKYAIDNDLPVEDNLRRFKSKSGAQEAHEAIRPTSFLLKEVGSGQIQELYDLIWMRSVACQLHAAKYVTKEVELEQDVSVIIDGSQELKVATFKARGRTLTYSGWLQLTDKDFSEVEDEDKEEMPNNPIPNNLAAGDLVEVANCQLKEKNTAPPNRLTASALIAKLESSGVGRPSTYASIIETLEIRNYIVYEKSRIHVTERGTKIIDVMEDHFKFIDVKYTSAMEDTLDLIASGKEWFPITKNFWDEINSEVDAFVQHIHKTLPQHKCEDCNGLVIKRTSPKGVYWSCVLCAAKYSDGNNKPGIMNVARETGHKCYDCDRNLVYRKGSYEGNDYEYFGCSGVYDTLNKCYAKYEVIKEGADVSPDIEKYKLKSQYKCSICSRRLGQFSTKAKPGSPSRKYWRCEGNTKENPTCHAFYDDRNDTPDFEKFALDHEYKCKNCNGYIQRRKVKDSDRYYWLCKNMLSDKKTKCGIFYDDLNEKPDYEKYDSDHKHKCTNCGSYVARRKNKHGQSIWRCSYVDNKCGWEFSDEDGVPNLESAKEVYLHKCKKCKLGFLKKASNDRGVYWGCSNWQCKTFLPDDAGVPDFEYVKPEK